MGEIIFTVDIIAAVFAAIALIYGVFAIANAIWRGDPHARLMKRRRHYLKRVRA